MPSVGPYTTPPPTKRDRLGGLVREAIGGDKRAAIRRIVLWTALFAAIAAPVPLWVPLGIATILLATDDLV